MTVLFMELGREREVPHEGRFMDLWTIALYSLLMLFLVPVTLQLVTVSLEGEV